MSYKKIYSFWWHIIRGEATARCVGVPIGWARDIFAEQKEHTLVELFYTFMQ